MRINVEVETVADLNQHQITSIQQQWCNKIILGDCLDILKRMPSDSVDLIVTSPLRRKSDGVAAASRHRQFN